jgi:hypothetical protein
MAFIQERIRIVIPMEWLYSLVEVSLLLVSHSSCLWVRIRKQLTHYTMLGVICICYNGCLLAIALLLSICQIQTDGNEQ